MEGKRIPSNVVEILEWKNRTKNENWQESVEDFNATYTAYCGGREMTDVLFSFLGIYSIGVWIYNKDKLDVFKIESNKIKLRVEKDKNYNQILCSKKFLLQLQEDKIAGIEVSDLNECLSEFARVYFSVGNLIPMWPGGNKLKGNQNKGFMDIPELFFVQYYDWYEILRKREMAYLEEMAEYLNVNKSCFVSLKSFLDSVNTVEKYEKYIEHVVSVIHERTRVINESL